MKISIHSSRAYTNTQKYSLEILEVTDNTSPELQIRFGTFDQRFRDYRFSESDILFMHGFVGSSSLGYYADLVLGLFVFLA